MGHMHGVYTYLHGQRIMSYVDLVGKYVTVSSKGTSRVVTPWIFSETKCIYIGGNFFLVYLVAQFLHQ